MTGQDDTQGSRFDGVDTGGLRVVRRSALLDEARRYWTSLRAGGALPRRSALDPVRMQRILGHAMVLDRMRHGTVRVRLGGGVMRGLMGMDVRGLPIRAFFDLEDRTRALSLFEEVFDAPATLELDLVSRGSGPMVTGRMLVLPLVDAAGAVTKALAVTVTDHPVEDPPRRFAITNAELVPTGAGERPAVAPKALPRRRVTDRPLPVELATGMAETQAPFDSSGGPVPWLRVVK